MRGSISPRFLLLAGLGLVYFVFIPFFYAGSKYFLNILITCSVLSLISMGVWITFSLGLVNIGQAAFCTIGAYTTAILSVKYGLSFWLCLPLSGLAAAGVGMLIGIPILRLRGVYFAMITLSFGEAVRLLFMNGGSFTGGPDGIWGIPRPQGVSLGGWTVIPAFTAADYLSFHYLAALLLLASLVIVWRLDRCRLGWIFRAIRQSDSLSASVGIPIAKYRVIAFGASCFLGGIGGSFFAAYMTNIYPNSYTIGDSINFMLYCFLGGLQYLLGPVLGSFVLTGSFEALRAFMKQEYQALFYALVIIFTILWLPNGLLSLEVGRKEMKEPGEIPEPGG